MPRLSEESGILFIEDLSNSKVEKINFVGGEPMLHPHLETWIITRRG